MKIGYSGGLRWIETAAKLGYDYFETGVADIAALSDEAFAEAKANVAAAGIPLLAGNATFPKATPLAGPEVDIGATERHLRHAFRRMAELGCRIVVMGSGKRREYPEDFPRETAVRQLALAATLMGEIAAENGMVAVMEPLCRKETNLINTVTEGGEFVEQVNCPGFLLLADYYHMAADGENMDGLKTYGKLLRHAHIAEPEGRGPVPTGSDACAPFFAALKEIGYTGMLSFEGIMPKEGTEEAMAETLASLRRFAEKYGL